MRSEGSRIRQVKHKIVERIAVWTNRYMYKPHVQWVVDQSWLDPYRPYMQHDPSLRRPQVRNLDRRYVLIEFARSTRNLKGSTAECGVARGVGSALICKALEGTYSDTDRHFGFDAFQGLAEPTELDRMTSSAEGWKAGDVAHDGSLARAAFEAFAQAELRVGWIPETFMGLEERQYRFVHIDVDLAESTHESLAYFYPRLAAGGIMILDDHGFTTCPGARKVAIEYFSDMPETVIDLPTGQGLVIKHPHP